MTRVRQQDVRVVSVVLRTQLALVLNAAAAAGAGVGAGVAAVSSLAFNAARPPLNDLGKPYTA